LSRSPGERVLIVNADDFGRSEGINRGVMKANEDGIVTSASLMVRWPAAGQAAALAKGAPSLSLGLHVDLTEWVWDGGWRRVYEIVSPHDQAVVEQEIRRQLDRFRDLTGEDPSHLDSHQHVHRHERAVSAVLERLGDELGRPVRALNGRILYCGDFYGQTPEGEPLHEAIGVEGLIRTIRALEVGTTELCCHPGLGNDFESSYSREREWEVETLCDERVRSAIEAEQIELRSFAEI
jgi:predicted glycoside hydrolase/deacetylase ChbG (UPF0249 family)